MSEETKRPAFAMLDELKQLRGAGVQQTALNLCALTLRQLQTVPVQDAINQLEHFAREKLADQPALVQSLVQHVNAMRAPADFLRVAAHFERMALTSALLGAMVQAVGRLQQGQPT